MKGRHGLIALLLGLCLEATALIFKFEHWTYTPLIVIIAMLLKIFGLLLLGWKVLRWPGFKQFWDQ